MLQPKLLRVLQEQEFERLGSGETHRINVRLIGATHRDLAEMVRQREFRSDLRCLLIADDCGAGAGDAP